jgi:hypothetical protein
MLPSTRDWDKTEQKSGCVLLQAARLQELHRVEPAGPGDKSPADSINRDQKGSIVGPSQAQSSTAASLHAAAQAQEANGPLVLSDSEGRMGIGTPGKATKKVNRAGRVKPGGTPLKKCMAGSSKGKRGPTSTGAAEGGADGREEQGAEDEGGSNWGEEGDWNREAGLRRRRRGGGRFKRVLAFMGGMGTVAAAAAGVTASVMQRQQRAATG